MSQQNDTARSIAERVMAAPLEQRSGMLQALCGDDASLRASVESTLGDLEGDGDGLRNRGTVLTTPPESTEPTHLPSSIGHFSVRRVIGSGGMGTVYEAMQESPRRKVAVKVMKRGVTSRSAMRRFQLEAQVLARLHHPGIAQIYEAGTWDDGSGGVPFFAMELISGAKSLTEFAVDKQLDTKGRVELFNQVCDAVHHGHQKGIIHRDLKPGNILVDRRGAPKVIDFGVARSTDSDMAVTTQQTDVGALIGTLQYMSPEQCEADPDLIDIRSDVYALGVILYELLCGRTPYDLGSMAIYDAVKIVREQPAARLSVVNPVLRGDMETIVAKALAKDPDYRYQSALHLQQDLERYLKGEAISARPLSLTYQLSLLMRRNRAAVVAAGVIAVVLVVATVVSIVLAVRASNAEGRAVQAQVLAVEAQSLTEAQLQKARVGQAFQRDILAMSSPRNAQGRTLSTQQILIEAAAGIDERFDELPELAAETRLMVGELMFELQMFGEADRQLTTAIAALEARQGMDDPRVIQAMVTQGRLWTEQGRAKEADKATTEALARAGRVLAEDDPVRIEAQRARVLALEFLTEHLQALELAEAWLAVAKRRYGERHEMTIEAQSVLGRLHLHASEFETKVWKQRQLQDDGMQLLLTATEVGEEVLGPRHPVTLQARVLKDFITWSVALRSEDEADAREQDIVQTTEALQAVLGKDHTFVLDVLHQHGRVLVIIGISRGGQDWIARGEDLLQQSHEGYLRRVGPDHPLTLAVEVDLAQARVHGGSGGSVIEALQNSYDRLAQIHTEDHNEVVRARALLAVELLKDGQLEEGVPLMRTTIELVGAMLGPLHPEVAGMRILLAGALIKHGQIDRGLAEGETMLALGKDGFQEGKAGYINLWRHVGDLYDKADRPDRALKLYAEAAQTAIDHLAPISSSRADVLASYAGALLEQDRPREAMEIVNEAKEGYILRENAGVHRLLRLDLLRIRAFVGLDRLPEASAAFTRVLEGQESPRAKLTVLKMTADMNVGTLIVAIGETMMSAALLARDEFEPDGNADLVWRDAVIAKLHHARGDFALAVQWQEQAVEAADADHLDDAQKTLDAYRASVNAATP